MLKFVLFILAGNKNDKIKVIKGSLLHRDDDNAED